MLYPLSYGGTFIAICYVLNARTIGERYKAMLDCRPGPR